MTDANHPHPELDEPRNASLERGSYTPLYRQLYFRLIDDIQNGRFAVGERLPSERVLAENYHVSRITAAQAVEALVKVGIVYREQGRGTFIANQSFGRFSFRSFTADTRARGKTPSSKVIEFNTRKADSTVAGKLKIQEGQEYFDITRVRLADNVPVALQHHAITARHCPYLAIQDLETGSLLNILRSSQGIVPTWIEPVIKMTIAGNAEARLLEVSPGSPLISVDAVTFTETFEVVEWVTTLYRGDTLALYLGRQRMDETL